MRQTVSSPGLFPYSLVKEILVSDGFGATWNKRLHFLFSSIARCVHVTKYCPRRCEWKHWLHLPEKASYRELAQVGGSTFPLLPLQLLPSLQLGSDGWSSRSCLGLYGYLEDGALCNRKSEAWILLVTVEQPHQSESAYLWTSLRFFFLWCEEKKKLPYC